MQPIKIENSIVIENVKDLQIFYNNIKSDISQRTLEFDMIGKFGDKLDLFKELVFCILTANASAKMGLKSIDALDDTIFEGNKEDIESKLKGVYRYPTSRSGYIVRTRDFLQKYDLDLRKIFDQFKDQNELRDFLVINIVGIGYKECSHFLRNVGFKGFAILDKHVISMLNLLECNVEKPTNKKQYLIIEQKMKDFAKQSDINFDDLDLLLWSYRTGEIIK